MRKAARDLAAAVFDSRARRDGDAWVVTVPIHTVSELNARDHWGKLQRRKKGQKEVIALTVGPLSRRLRPPLRVTMTRLGAGKMDEHENLPAAFKAIVDQISRLFGIDDGSGAIAWAYAQRKVPRGTYGVELRFEPLSSSAPQTQ